jgi:exo-beta-1,3-glucanase (GH17 family)
MQNHWKYLRLYDCSVHAETVLRVIETEKLDFKVMLGASIGAELNNFGCPWGATLSEAELENNKQENLAEIKRLINIANQYPEIIFALSAGNEATVDWTDHYVSVETVTAFVKMIKNGARQPVTFCENYVPWYDKLKTLAAEVDFISIHSYPVWEYKNIHEAMEYTKLNFQGIADRYPDKPVIITEAGWATNSNGRGINPENVSEEFQSVYYNDLMEWSDNEGIMTFTFEAFDEPWKGSPEALEPEKHWGLYTVDRKPKKVFQHSTINL